MYKCWNCGTEHELLASDDAYSRGYRDGYNKGYKDAAPWMDEEYDTV